MALVLLFTIVALIATTTTTSAFSFVPQFPTCLIFNHGRRWDHRSSSSRTTTVTERMTMRVSRGRSKVSGIKGSTIAQVNWERTSTAGKRGKKNFIDPNKVFVGNLPYDVGEDDLKQWLDQQGIITQYMVKSIKIVREWRTNESKGYGFIQFFSPIYATSAIVSLTNKSFHGRTIRLHQGKKKRDPSTIYIVKNNTLSSPDEEDLVISNAIIEDREDNDDDEDIYDDEDDMEEFDMEESDYDQQEGSSTTIASNRATRRKADRAMHKKKKIFRGFGEL
mmetsp:Transcript_18931/g.26913  ORF Transcript_18931/g.26913 Transcript_18931/m.26913 type:complete len:278 (+) Transcript_18931:54-887(+)